MSSCSLSLVPYWEAPLSMGLEPKQLLSLKTLQFPGVVARWAWPWNWTKLSQCEAGSVWSASVLKLRAQVHHSQRESEHMGRWRPWQPFQGAPNPLFNHGCGPVVADVYHRLFIRGKCGHISISFVGFTVALLGLMWEVVTVRRRVK